jgi:3-hydroxyisobutyrate dehydrogenase-like beta-hydroxyacid dehydrogenase
MLLARYVTVDVDNQDVGKDLRPCTDFIKDMGIALAEAEKMNLSLPGLALAKQLYEAVRAQGYGRKGTQALLLALETLNGVKR